MLDYLHCRGEYSDRQKWVPQVILLDLKKPKVDGFAVLRQLKADKDLCTIPVVILTSSNEDSDLVESYGLGANAYVVKPVIFNDFIKAVKELGRFWLQVNEAPRSFSAA